MKSYLGTSQEAEEIYETLESWSLFISNHYITSHKDEPVCHLALLLAREKRSFEVSICLGITGSFIYFSRKV